jgi:hypothetical protein
VTFADCLRQCVSTPEFVAQFDRLTGNHLTEMVARSPLDEMIDKATGRDRAAWLGFIIFVDEMVWSRLDKGAS